jgi:hypothetical protein
MYESFQRNNQQLATQLISEQQPNEAQNKDQLKPHIMFFGKNITNEIQLGYQVKITVHGSMHIVLGISDTML